MPSWGQVEEAIANLSTHGWGASSFKTALIDALGDDQEHSRALTTTLGRIELWARSTKALEKAKKRCAEYCDEMKVLESWRCIDDALFVNVDDNEKVVAVRTGLTDIREASAELPEGTFLRELATAAVQKVQGAGAGEDVAPPATAATAAPAAAMPGDPGDAGDTTDTPSQKLKRKGTKLAAGEETEVKRRRGGRGKGAR